MKIEKVEEINEKISVVHVTLSIKDQFDIMRRDPTAKHHEIDMLESEFTEEELHKEKTWQYATDPIRAENIVKQFKAIILEMKKP